MAPVRILIVNPNTTASMTDKIRACAESVRGPDTSISAVNPSTGPRVEVPRLVRLRVRNDFCRCLRTNFIDKVGLSNACKFTLIDGSANVDWVLGSGTGYSIYRGALERGQLFPFGPKYAQCMGFGMQALLQQLIIGHGKEQRPAG